MATSKSASYAADVQRVVWVTLWLNLAVALAKIAYGRWARIVSLQADGIHSLLDAFANVVGLIGMRFAAAPADADHPYGHRRMEHLAAAGVGVLILFGVYEVGKGTYEALVGDARPEVGVGGVVVILATLAVNAYVTRYESRRGHDLHSPFLLADARHTQSDLFATSLVLIAYGGAAAGWRWADPVCALIVMGMIARAGILVIRENVAVLVDAAVLDPEELRRVVTGVPFVAGCHKVRSRGSRSAVLVDLHIQVAPSMTVLEGHALSHRVKDELMRRFPQIEDVLVHLEPDVPDERLDD